MDTTAHRTLKATRDNLVETFRLGLLDLAHRPEHGWPHGVNQDQAAEIDSIVWRLWDLMTNDPTPPECQNCATGITQPTIGRPRRYCSDACRQQDARR